MTKKQIPIYATVADIRILLTYIKDLKELELATMGAFDEPSSDVQINIENIRQCASYLVFDKGICILSRQVTQRDGVQKYVIDQIMNPDTVVINCGGFVEEARLTASQIGTATTSEKSGDMFLLLSKSIRRKFVKIKSYYVGGEAAQLLDSGVRLAPTAHSPVEYDLVR